MLAGDAIARKSLKTWSGRRGSNPRRPAWEYDCKLETKSIAFPGTSFWRLRIPRFHSMLSSRIKRNTRQSEHLQAQLPLWHGQSLDHQLPHRPGKVEQRWTLQKQRRLPRLPGDCSTSTRFARRVNRPALDFPIKRRNPLDGITHPFSQGDLPIFRVIVRRSFLQSVTNQGIGQQPLLQVIVLDGDAVRLRGDQYLGSFVVCQ